MSDLFASRMMVSPMEPQNGFESFNALVSSWLDWAYGNSIAYVLMFLLLGVGIWLTFTSKFMQVTMFPHMLREILSSRKGAKGGISSFQAFAIGLADRVGTGAIAGVALAVVAGGPGSVFWMWVVAAVGMVTAFVEATLAQLYKVRNGDGTFRGGPAYYIQRGIGSRGWGILFAVLLIFAYGFSFQMIQANSVAQLAASDHLGIPTWVSAVVLVILVLPLVLGGIRKIAHFSEIIAPVMALVYVLMGVVVMVVNFTEIPHVFMEIFRGAFGQGEYLHQVGLGAGAAFLVALQVGVKRGLFTNEAGMGSAPNAAATATVKHPVTQGMVQSLGVFVDTMLVCTATAFIILMSKPYWEQVGSPNADGTVLTSDSLISSLASSDFGKHLVFGFLLVMMITFAYSTILGNYAYAEANYLYIVGLTKSPLPLKLLVIVATALGAVLPLSSVWSLSDWASAMMAIVNLVALIFLGKWALGALKDYRAQLKQGVKEPVFCSANNPHLPDELPTDVWTVPGGYHEDWANEKISDRI